MKHTSESNESDESIKLRKHQSLIERTTLAVSAACCGIVLYLALFPGFYYMAWIFFGMVLWAVVAACCLFQALASQALARRMRTPLPHSRYSGVGFIAGMLLFVSVLIAFKIPLLASFLLARPGLEEALEQHHDDLSQVGLVSHNYGIYQFRKADRRCHRKDRVFFQFRDDGEAAIIYSENGIDDLCYNSGSKGHLLGNWYWMKED